MLIVNVCIKRKHVDKIAIPGSTVGVDFCEYIHYLRVPLCVRVVVLKFGCGGGSPLIDIHLMTGGVVEEVGSQVTKSWKKGDRIAGFCHGGNESQFEDGERTLYVYKNTCTDEIGAIGAFGEYCVMKGDLGLKVSQVLQKVSLNRKRDREREKESLISERLLAPLDPRLSQRRRSGESRHRCNYVWTGFVSKSRIATTRVWKIWGLRPDLWR